MPSLSWSSYRAITIISLVLLPLMGVIGAGFTALTWNEFDPNSSLLPFHDHQASSDAQSHPMEAEIDGFFTSSGHTNNWAVLVCTSRFWFNYRHIANTLSMYRTVKRLGIPDSNIILMLSDDVACNPRNKFPATVFNDNSRDMDLYGSNVEVDYRGYDVTVESFIRLLTGRHEPDVPRNKRLLTDEYSNILIFMTGHGGDDFLKFQDSEEIGAMDLADALGQMWEKKRYHEIFFLIDTCQAASMYKRLYTPNVIAAASSLVGESSYSHTLDFDIGVAVIDRFTYYSLLELEKIDRASQRTLKNMFDSYDPVAIHSTPGIRTDLFKRQTSETLLTDFFGGVQSVELSDSRYPLQLEIDPSLVQWSRKQMETSWAEIVTQSPTFQPFRMRITELRVDHGRRFFSISGMVGLGVMGAISWFL